MRDRQGGGHSREASAGHGAARAVDAQGRLVAGVALAHVAAASAVAAALDAVQVEAALSGLEALARRALMLVVAPAGAAEAEPLWEDSAAADSVPPEPRPGQSPRPRTEALPRPPALTVALADLAVVALAVDVVALAELAVDLLVGHVARVAHALPADAVPQPRADDGAVVLAAAAPPAPGCSGRASGTRSSSRCSRRRTCGNAGVRGPRGAPRFRAPAPGGGRGAASPADVALHRASATADAAVPAGFPALALALGKDPHGHRVREAQRPDGEGLLLDALGGCDLHLEGDLSWGT